MSVFRNSFLMSFNSALIPLRVLAYSFTPSTTSTYPLASCFISSRVSLFCCFNCSRWIYCSLNASFCISICLVFSFSISNCTLLSVEDVPVPTFSVVVALPVLTFTSILALLRFLIMPSATLNCSFNDFTASTDSVMPFICI